MKCVNILFFFFFLIFDWKVNDVANIHFFYLYRCFIRRMKTIFTLLTLFPHSPNMKFILLFVFISFLKPYFCQVMKGSNQSILATCLVDPDCGLAIN